MASKDCRLFTAPDCGAVGSNDFMKRVRRPACEKPTYRQASGFHSLRHHYPSLLIKHGESVKTVSERLGHTNAAMTPNICIHLWPDSEERTRAAVDNGYADHPRARGTRPAQEAA